MRKSYENEVDDDGVSEMYVCFWTGVEINIILDRDALRIWFFFKLCSSAIFVPCQEFYNMNRCEIDVWHHRLNHHCFHDLVSYHIIPILNKITKLIRDGQPTYRSVFEISVCQEKNKTGI